MGWGDQQRSASPRARARRQPALTCYLPEPNTFVRWLTADSAAELIDAATAIVCGAAAE